MPVFCMFFLIVRHQVQVWKESWIVGVKGKNNINSDNYGILLNGDRTQWLVKRGDTEVRTIDIEASRAVEDNPLFYHNVYTRGDKKIGYLVYNHFTSGPNGYSDRTYDEEMKKIFAGFQAQGVNNLCWTCAIMEVDMRILLICSQDSSFQKLLEKGVCCFL